MVVKIVDLAPLNYLLKILIINYSDGVDDVVDTK
jgi:hypothetical protein